ncbi:YfjI family protein [uncultured Pseudacidovorax sp.]|uniref:YfjI family protein n=1 Tax=uncultured Pseudacidovorax sp. TaxID=679313 RepID=UPI0025FDFFA9|nr:YfjI family protein [uncultured Pseudacidovorax sp.]
MSELPPAPAFDAEALLPQSLAHFVLDEADRMPCAPDYIAAALLVCLGSVIGARCGIKPKRRDDWIVTPNLYGGIVGDPSVKKSPALSTVTRFLDRLEAQEVEKLDAAMKVYESEKAAFEAHQAAVKANMKKAAAGKPDQDKMAAAMADLQTLEEPEEPHARRYKSNDSTVEKLGDLLAHNPQGMLVFRDELIGLLSSWEKEGREGDKAFYLEGWNGTSSFSIDRISRGSLHIKNLCLSVFGGIQPDLLERYLAGISSSLDNDGRIQRFQVLVYPDRVAWEWRDRHPVKGAREAVRDLFDRLAVFDPVQDGAAPADDFVKLPHFHFDDEAQSIFIEWCTELHSALIPREHNPLMQQHLGKFEKLFCAVALILHVAEGQIGPVTAATALRAASWCEYLAGHARRVYGLVEASKVNTARMVARRLQQGKLLDGFTVRDVVRKQWAGVTSSMQAEGALATLEEGGWVQGVETDNPTGRPTVRYYINPKIGEVSA